MVGTPPLDMGLVIRYSWVECGPVCPLELGQRKGSFRLPLGSAAMASEAQVACGRVGLGWPKASTNSQSQTLVM